MEFDIDICTGVNGRITIEDCSYDYGQYYREDEENQEYGRYKYSECKTLQVVNKVTSNTTTLIDVLVHDHNSIENPETGESLYGVEQTVVHLKKDGYYTINHIVLPTTAWLNNTYLNSSDSYKNAFESIYIIGDDNRLYKYVESSLVEVTVAEVTGRNSAGTTIEKCILDVFYTGFLQNCYIHYCKKLFEKLNANNLCAPKKFDELTFARDFLWMLLNILDYQISFKRYMEAQRLLEMSNYCGGFCSKVESYDGPDVGCNCS